MPGLDSIQPDRYVVFHKGHSQKWVGVNDLVDVCKLISVVSLSQCVLQMSRDAQV